MSVFLTPGLQPFLGGTYFPPNDAFGRPGFATVLQKVAEAWRTRKADIEAQSTSVIGQIEAAISAEGMNLLLLLLEGGGTGADLILIGRCAAQNYKVILHQGLYRHALQCRLHCISTW